MGRLPSTKIHLVFCLALFMAEQAAAAPPVQLSASLSADVRRLVERLDQQPSLGTRASKLIIQAPATQDIRQLLQAQGSAPGYTRGPLTQITVTDDRLAGLLQSLPQGASVRLSYPHHPAEIISQGTGYIGAADFHDVGTDGAGIKIGIIDAGFAGLAGSQAGGELPPGQQFIDYTVFPPVPMSDDAGSDHGTNVAEIVHDTAPGAELYLAKISTDLELAAAVDEMIAAGINIIHQPLVWFGAAFYDGTGPICDITNDAEAADILWTNPAGNLRLNHYLNAFSDANSDLRHEFSVDQNYNTVVLQAGIPVNLTVNWDAYQSPASADYDLFLYDDDPDAGGTLVASSENGQSSGFPFPYETLDYLPETSGTFYIVVSKLSSSTPDLPLTLFSFSHPFSVNVTASSIAQPADCASVVTVGATALDDTPDSTSSVGPTTDGRNKPDISGPTGMETSRTIMFAGTSAASAYVAGSAALLSAQKAFCSLSLSDIRAALLNSVEDVDTPGFDFRTGQGRISLDADGDGFNHDSDNCKVIYNLDQLDSDGDQIGNACDTCEFIYNPDQLDTDGDRFGDACDTDDDNDGLSDDEEAGIGTDPLIADTDTDGLSDGDEINIHTTDPLLIDTDTDGLSDGDEITIHATYPLLIDSDNDQAGDGVEIAAGTNPLDSSSFPVTPDGDLNDDGSVDVRDVLIGQRVLMGELTLTPFQFGRGDVAPRVNGIATPDGEFNLGDVLVIQRKALGLVTF